MSFRKLLASFGGAWILATALPAAADGHCAATTVKNITVSEDGQVRISLNSAEAEKTMGEAINSNFRYKLLCDIDTSVNGITIDTCRQWVDQLTASFLSGRPVVLFYSGPASFCTPAATWGSVSTEITSLTLGNY